MKITIFISALSGGGAERVACNLANHLRMFGHEIELLTMMEKSPAELLVEGVVHTPLLTINEKSHPLINNIKRIYRLRKHMKKPNTDAYIVMLPITIELMLRLSRLTQAPIIMSERADPKRYSVRTQRKLRRLVSRASGVIFQTDEICAWYQSYMDDVKGVVIPNAINPVFIRTPYTGERKKTIIGVGRLTEQKNFALLIRAFARIADQFLDHKLVIYGKGRLLGILTALADELGVGGRVEFPGYAENMPEILEKAGMFVLSSDYEGMPNALMEAMALGVPCVSTDCGGGGARFLIKDGVNGLLVPQGNEEAMAEAMRSILENPVKAAMLAENSRKLQQTLAPDKVYGEWEKFIREIAGCR